MSNIGNIIDGLKGKSSSSYGFVHESAEWKTIAGVRAKVDKDGKVIDEKAKKLIEKRLGKTIDESGKGNTSKKLPSKKDILGMVGADSDKKMSFKEFGKLLAKETDNVNEDKWITIRGTHTLVDDKGDIQNKKLKDKIESTSKGKSSNKVESTKFDTKRMEKRKQTLKDSVKKAVKDGDVNKIGHALVDAVADIDNELLDEIKDDELTSKLVKSDDVMSGLTGMASDDLDTVSDDDIVGALKDSGITVSKSQAKDLRKHLEVIRDCKKEIQSIDDVDYDEDDEDKLADALGEQACKQLDATARMRRAQHSAAKVVGQALKDMFGGKLW